MRSRIRTLRTRPKAKAIDVPSAMLRAAERPLTMLPSDIQGGASSCPWPSVAFNPERRGAGEEALGAEISRDLNEEIAAPCALPARGARGFEGLDHGTRLTHLLRRGRHDAVDRWDMGRIDRALRHVAERARMARIGLAAGQVREGVGAIDREHLRGRALEMEALAGIGELGAGLATRGVEIGRE